MLEGCEMDRRKQKSPVLWFPLGLGFSQGLVEGKSRYFPKNIFIKKSWDRTG